VPPFGDVTGNGRPDAISFSLSLHMRATGEINLRRIMDMLPFLREHVVAILFMHKFHGSKETVKLSGLS
jgi:hypothetical protein